MTPWYLQRAVNAHNRVGLELKHQNSKEFPKRGHFWKRHSDWIKNSALESFSLIHSSQLKNQFRGISLPSHWLESSEVFPKLREIPFSLQPVEVLWWLLHSVRTQRRKQLPIPQIWIYKQRNSTTLQKIRNITESTFLYSLFSQVTGHIVIRKIEGTNVHLSILK